MESNGVLLPDNQLGDTSLQLQLAETAPESQETPAPETLTHALAALTPPAAQPAPEVQPPEDPHSKSPSPPAASCLSQSKPLEAFNWKELKDTGLDSYCSACKRPVPADPTRVIRKKGHVQLQCRTCHNITSLLYRRMDMKALSDWKDFTTAQTQSFFQRAGQCVSANGQLDFQKIKGCLVDEMSELEVHRQTTEMKSKFLPLSVWKTKGYDTDAIEARGEWKDSDMSLGALYKAEFQICKIQSSFAFNLCHDRT